MKLTPLAALAALLAALAPASAAEPVAALAAGFAHPPAATRPMVRWWWFGPAVVQPRLEHELELMKQGGFGGFEVQPTYPLALDGQYPGLKNFKFLSPEFFNLLRFTSVRAKDLGLRMDLTLGSGWPYGGPMFTREEAAQSIGDGGSVPVTPGEHRVEAPAPGGRRAIADAPVIAALLGPVKDAPAGTSPFMPLTVRGRTAELPADLHGATEVRFFVYAPAQLMQVKRAAYGAEGFIVDHYNPLAIEKFIDAVAQPEISACANPPYSIFCDSLEIQGEGWTPDLPAEFKRRRGYDLIPLLPALFDPGFPGAAEIRGDYGRTVAEVFDDVFVNRFASLAHADHTRFRLQAYGTPPTTLSTYARGDIDEGESYRWRAFSGTRWAASASHLLGRPEVSAEAFTWLHSPAFMAAPIDIKAESNLQFLCGVNHLLFHGWPYTAPGVEYPGWRFYAAAVFNEKNPWWIVMPDITTYLARTSYLLREGTPGSDVALYLPEEDAFSDVTPHNLQMVQAGGEGLLNERVNGLVPAILDAGHNFDGIDAGLLAQRGHVEGATLAFGDVKYHAVILPRMTRITPASLRTLEAFAKAGGLLIAVGNPPTVAPGYHASESDQQAVREISERLFSGPGAKGIVVAPEQLGATLAAKLPADVAFAQPLPTVGFIHRRLADADLYFIANTTNEPVTTLARFRTSYHHAEWWDANTGRKTPASRANGGTDAASVAIELPPYGARFLVFTSNPSHDLVRRPAGEGQASVMLDLTHDWDVTFKNAAPEQDPAPLHFTRLASWSDQPSTHFFSGVGTYVKHVHIGESTLAASALQELDFGSGTPTTVPGGMGMRAEFQPPVADAAVVYVNGRRAGAVWCPPYRVDVTGLLQPGDNEIRIEVANRAVNYMADQAHHPLPDYAELNASKKLGGHRFAPQDMDKIQVLPSGLLGTVKLIATSYTP